MTEHLMPHVIAQSVFQPQKDVNKKGSYDAFLKIIILCIWCNRICWHALMFKKHIIFQILYIIVGPSFQQVQSALIGQLAQCIVIGRTLQARTQDSAFDQSIANT